MRLRANRFKLRDSGIEVTTASDKRATCSQDAANGELWANAPCICTTGPALARHCELMKKISFTRALLALLAGVAGCATKSNIVARNTELTLAPTCADAVTVFPGRDKVPYDYYEVALIEAEGNSVYTGNGDLLKAARNQAAGVGANGLMLDSLTATHATVKVLGAVVGSKDAERKARAIAIWMPSDTARVRKVCAGK